MTSSSFMWMPGAKVMPGYDVLYVGPRKPELMGRAAAVGDVLEWDSATAGLWSRKEGRVIEVVPAGCRPNSLRSTEVRDHESYVVRSGTQVLWPAVSVTRLR